MTAPTFDAHGWCHDMDHPEAKSGQMLFLWVDSPGGRPFRDEGYWRAASGRWNFSTAFYRENPTVTAWRPLPLPPVGADGWCCDMSAAPKDRLIWIYAASREGLPAFQSECQWHPDGGFCVDEIRYPTAWRLDAPPDRVKEWPAPEGAE